MRFIPKVVWTFLNILGLKNVIGPTVLNFPKIKCHTQKKRKLEKRVEITFWESKKITNKDSLFCLIIKILPRAIVPFTGKNVEAKIWANFKKRS